MMTPEERAEKIVVAMEVPGTTWKLFVTEYITSQIKQACEEAREVKIRDEYDLVDGLRKKAFIEGFSDALDRAAKVAEESFLNSYTEFEGTIEESSLQIAGEEISKKILALKPEGE